MLPPALLLELLLALPPVLPQVWPALLLLALPCVADFAHSQEGRRSQGLIAPCLSKK